MTNIDRLIKAYTRGSIEDTKRYMYSGEVSATESNADGLTLLH